MTVRAVKLTFSLPYAQSLKDKRQVVRSLLDKARHRFNVSIAEVDAQDAHQTLVVGIAVVSGNAAHAGDMLEIILRFMEENAEAELLSVEEM